MITTREQIVEMLKGEDLTSYDLYIWGTGNTANLYLEGIKRLQMDKEILGYADNNSEKWGKEFAGKPIYSPQEIKEKTNVLMLIASPNPKIIKAVAGQLTEMNIKWRHIDDYILKRFKDEVIACYDLLEDEKSKVTFAGLIECRIQGKYPDYSIIDIDQYFSFEYFSDYDPTEVYVDCGAYVGDTIEKYIWKMDGSFKKIYAFEPDESNMQALNCRLDRLKKEWNLSEDKFEIYPYGLSDHNTINYMERYENNNGFGSKLLESGNQNIKECKVVSLDEFINGEIGFIKADIESYEYKLLKGAERSIQQYSPKLAICIYHNAADFFQIPLLVKKINPKYHLAIRHYTCVLSETILYAYIKD